MDVDISVLESQNIELADADWIEHDQDAVDGEQEEEELDYGELEDHESIPGDLSSSSGVEDNEQGDDDVFLSEDCNPDEYVLFSVIQRQALRTES